MNKRVPNKKNVNNSTDGSYWIYGKHACTAALNNPRREIKEALITENNEKEFNRLLGRNTVRIGTLHDFKKIFGEAVHQGIALNVKPLPGTNLNSIIKTATKIAILDSITDPHNIGAIIRSANAFYIDCVIVQDKGFSQAKGIIEKVASGAVESVPIVMVTNLADTITELKQHGFWVAGLAGEAENNIDKTKSYEKTAIVLGAEGKGLRPKIAKYCDFLVKIPMNELQESLNVSNAAAITFYELFKLES